ncbi:MAG: hypothetical protein HY547_03970, partial [Elusimicrobia bacterium]|nr:hypothetical protein [Elusimicrobiota bacterium]
MNQTSLSLGMPSPKEALKSVDWNSVFLTSAVMIFLFYPFKGLVCALAAITLGVSSFADFFVPFLGVSAVVSLGFVVARARTMRMIDFWLLLFGVIACSIGIFRENWIYVKVAAVVLILPAFLFYLGSVPSVIFRKLLGVFFSLALIYSTVEIIIVQGHKLGILDEMVSPEEIGNFYDLLSMKKLSGSSGALASGNVIDFRHWGAMGGFRTGGFLGHPLQFPAIMSMMATFYYLKFRKNWSLI